MLRHITYQEAEDLTKLGVEVWYTYANKQAILQAGGGVMARCSNWLKHWPLDTIRSANFFVEEE